MLEFSVLGVFWICSEEALHAIEDIDRLDVAHAEDGHRHDVQLEVLPDDLVLVELAPGFCDQYLVVIFLEYEIEAVRRDCDRMSILADLLGVVDLIHEYAIGAKDFVRRKVQVHGDY